MASSSRGCRAALSSRLSRDAAKACLYAFIISIAVVIFIATSLYYFVPRRPLPFEYHKGPLLQGRISVNLIWYGKFYPSQRAIVSDFITSLTPNASSPQSEPSVAAWWKTATEKYYNLANYSSPPSLYLNKQLVDVAYSLGKFLTQKQLVELASRGEKSNAINVLLTAFDVDVPGFCFRCGTHGAAANNNFTYIWVGNGAAQCPSYCMWPFDQTFYHDGPQMMLPPNHDVGLDGMVIKLSGLLVETATNPFGNGFYQGPKSLVEAASACRMELAKGAVGWYPGDMLVDSTTGASYNAHGANGRKYALSGIYDPSISKCWTLV